MHQAFVDTLPAMLRSQIKCALDPMYVQKSGNALLDAGAADEQCVQTKVQKKLMKNLTLTFRLLKFLLALLILGTLVVGCNHEVTRTAELETYDSKLSQRIAVVVPDSDNPVSTLPFTFALERDWRLEDVFLDREAGSVQVARRGSVIHTNGMSITFYVGVRTKENDPFVTPSLNEPPFVTHEFSSSSANVRISIEQVDYIAEGKVRVTAAWSDGTFVAISTETQPVAPPSEDAVFQLGKMLLSIRT